MAKVEVRRQWNLERLLWADADRSWQRPGAQGEVREHLRAAAVALSTARAALEGLRKVRPSNWDDDEDPDQKAAWLAADAALGTPVAPASSAAPSCTHVLRAEGKVYPRTCEHCRLGPCPFFNNDGSRK